ncbi:MAG: hypothetical protein P8P91_20245, partial [Pseudomonadales bacterium]|nr:hypothetical protein [Pseudomonadales bacterium]
DELADTPHHHTKRCNSHPTVISTEGANTQPSSRPEWRSHAAERSPPLKTQIPPLPFLRRLQSNRRRCYTASAARTRTKLSHLPVS